ncbi:MAG: hypothetical protein V4574_14765 [Pseudomonadota bacterium]
MMLGFLLAALLMVPAQDAPLLPPTFSMTAPDGSQQIFIGVIAHGSGEDLDKVEAAAKAAKLTSGRVQGPDGKSEVMILFDSTTSKETGYGFYQTARSGGFGKLTVETILVPPSAIRKAQ